MLGAAFAAPLLQWLNIDGGIIHIFGESSSGKTTTQRVAQSVWGHGATTSESWNTTAYALTNNAAARNDGLLSMDEIGEDGSGRSVDQSIYSLANGKGRALGNKDGGNRPEIRFRVYPFSQQQFRLHMRPARLFQAHGRIHPQCKCSVLAKKTVAVAPILARRG